MMALNQDERVSVASTWAALASVYGQEIQRPALKIMVDAVQDLPVEAVIKALHDWPKHSKLARHPYPAEVRDLVSPAQSDDAVAREAAAKIQQAVSKFGSWRGDEARAFIGETGWAVIKRMGGWGYVCENLGIRLDVLHFQATARELVKSQLALKPFEDQSHMDALAAPDSSKGSAVSFEKTGTLELITKLSDQKSLNAQCAQQIIENEKQQGGDKQ